MTQILFQGCNPVSRRNPTESRSHTGQLLTSLQLHGKKSMQHAQCASAKMQHIYVTQHTDADPCVQEKGIPAGPVPSRMDQVCSKKAWNALRDLQAWRITREEERPTFGLTREGPKASWPRRHSAKAGCVSQQLNVRVWACTCVTKEHLHAGHAEDPKPHAAGCACADRCCHMHTWSAHMQIAPRKAHVWAAPAARTPAACALALGSFLKHQLHADNKLESKEGSSSFFLISIRFLCCTL